MDGEDQRCLTFHGTNAMPPKSLNNHMPFKGITEKILTTPRGAVAWLLISLT